MLFMLRFHDKHDQLAVRERYLLAHLDWLRRHKDTIKVAGSLRTAPGLAPAGACWIVEATDQAAAELIYLSDPFWLHGLRADVEVWHWSKAFPDIFTEI